MNKILIAAINSKYIHTNLAVRYIKGYVERYSDKKIDIYETSINNNMLKVIRDIFDEAPDTLIFSTYIWNKEYIFKLVKEIKKVLPMTKIILGGPEVSYNSKKILENFLEVDYITVGEGEKTTLDLLNEEIEEVKGVYYRKDGEVIFNGHQETIKDLDEIPFPYSEKELRENKTQIFYYESSRGCPYMCSYCMSSLDKNVRYFSIGRVREDLNKFLENGIKLIKFVDRTFNLKKERYMEIWEHLLSIYQEGITFHFEISGDLFDDEVIEFLEGVPKDYFQFEIGVQTINPITMKTIRRNTDLDRLEKNVLRIKDNIHLHLDLIAGLPYEDYETFKRSFDYVHNMYPEMVQLGFLKVLEGTQISKEVEEFDYKYLNYPPYEVLSNKYISYKEITRLKDVEEVLDYYYNSEKYPNSIKYIIDNHYDSSFDLYEEIANYFKDKGYLKISHKWNSLFDYLYEFYLEKRFEDIDIFKEILKFDYTLQGKPGKYPYWVKDTKDKELHREVLEEMGYKSSRESYKKTELQRFSYDVLKGIKREVNLLFVYNKDVVVKEC